MPEIKKIKTLEMFVVLVAVADPGFEGRGPCQRGGRGGVEHH